MIPRIEKAEKSVIEQEEQVNDVIDMLYVGNDSIKAANAQSYFANIANGFTQKLLKLKIKYAMQEELYDSLFVNGLMNLVNILVFCIGGFRVLQGAVTFGAVNTFTFYFSTLWSNVEGFMSFLKQYNDKQISLKRLSEFYEEAHEDTMEQSTFLPSFEQLRLQDVSLSLDNSLILSKFNLTVNKGGKDNYHRGKWKWKDNACATVGKIDSTERRLYYIQRHELSRNCIHKVERAYPACPC